MTVTNRSRPRPDGSSEAPALFGLPIAVAASYISAAMRMPSSGGLNQRERTNIDRLVRTSASRTSGERRVPMAHNTGRRNHLLQPPRPCLRRKEAAHIGIVEPEIAQGRGRQIVTDRAREHRTVDAACRGSGDDVDDDPQVDLAPDFAQQIEIDRFGVVLRIVAVDQRVEGGTRALRRGR